MWGSQRAPHIANSLPGTYLLVSSLLCESRGLQSLLSAMSLSKLTLLLTGVACTVAQYVSPPTDLITKIGYAGYQVRYKEVPKGICELSDAKSYSGYVDVSSDQVSKQSF